MIERKYPFYLKSTVILFGLTLFVYAVSHLREILLPIAFALMLSILLNPLCNWFVKKKIPHVLAITFTLLVAIFIIAGITYFISFQIGSFCSELPLLKKKYIELFAQLQTVIDKKLNINVQNKTNG